MRLPDPTLSLGSPPRFLTLLAVVLATAMSLVAGPAFADPKAEKDAQALQKKAIEEDNLNVNYPAAVKKLEGAIAKCGGSKCNPGLVATLTRDLGAMQILNGAVDEGKANFGKAIALDASLDLDPSYKNPMLSGIWAEVKKKGGGGGGGTGGGGGAPPASGGGGGPPPAGDFAHSPAPEAPTRTPLPVYAEYTGSEELKRVIVKYQAAGMSDWKSLTLKKSDSGFAGLISCKDVNAGDMKYFIQGFDSNDNPVATSGSKTKPYVVPVKDALDGPPPSLPGQDPPKQCGGGGGGGPGDDCPPGMEGCASSGKDAGEACEKDKDCKSHSCIDSACAEGGKEFGADCEKDGECKSGSCQDSKCAAGGNKKGPGEDCDADDQCDSGKCQDEKCAEGGAGGGKFPRIWLGLSLQLDDYLLPGGTDVCRLDTSASYTTAYACVASPNNVDLRPFGATQAAPGLLVNDPFPGTTKPGLAFNKNIIPSSKPVGGVSYDQVSGGFKFGNLRILASFDYALNNNILLGLRAGYVLFTDPTSGSPAPFAPVHAEGRFTYLLGKNAISRGGVAPMFFGGIGIGEFDAYLPVAVAVAAPTGNGTGVFGANAWATSGPFFLAGGGGVRIGIGQKVALTGALKLELGVGGTAGTLLGLAPEIGMQFGL